MKAILLKKYGPPGELKLQEIDTPEPQEAEVLVKVRAAAVNDWDWTLVRGKPFYIRLICGLFRPKFPIPGVEIAGTVEKAGRKVSNFKKGDHVYGDISECGLGGFAEYVSVPESALSLKPTNMSFSEAAALPHAFMLATQGLCDLGKIQPGQALLINGAGGGVGTLGIQIANNNGVTKTTGVDSAGKQAMLREAGFEKTIDYQQEDFTRSKLRYDLILDTKTSRSPFSYLRVLKPEGKYITVGGSAFRLIQMAILSPIIRLFSKKRIHIVALKANRDLAAINELYQAGLLRPKLDKPFKLNEIDQALQYFGEGRHQGKVIIEIQGEENV